MKKGHLKKIFFIIIIVLLILISGCKRKKDAEKSVEELRIGTEGITINFLQNNPPTEIHIEPSYESFDVILELRNKGAFPQPEDNIGAPPGKVFLSGYDTNIITIKAKQSKEFDLGVKALEGKSQINPNGGMDIATFKGSVEFGKLNVEKYDLTLMATACYEYKTIAEHSVCIEPDPYSIIEEKKICEVKDATLSSQGAPIAVTKIEEEAFAQKTQFKITIKNVGGGDVFRAKSVSQSSDSFNKCDPFGKEKLERDDIDKVLFSGAEVSDTALQCRPFAEEHPQGTSIGGPLASTFGYIRLINGEGSIICELTKEDYESYKKSKTSFTTTLRIELVYNYRITAERKLQIKKEMGGVGE